MDTELKGSISASLCDDGCSVSTTAGLSPSPSNTNRYHSDLVDSISLSSSIEITRNKRSLSATSIKPKSDNCYHRLQAEVYGSNNIYIKELRSFIGCMICGTLGSLYYAAPIYFIYLLVMCLWTLDKYYFYLFCLMVMLSVLPYYESEYIRTSWLMTCIAEYFNLEMIHDCHDTVYLNHKKNLLILALPHGVISFGGIGAATIGPKLYGRTAVANILLRVPVLRHVFGIFGTISSDRRSIKANLKKGHVFLYPGGLAELFLSDRNKEEVFFARRKGCIHVAMECGADILVCYIMGNTDMYNVVKHGPLARLSRAIQSSVTFFWGRLGLPIPFKTKVLFLVGTPLEIPDRRQSKPTKEEVDEVHGRVTEDIIRLFEEHKHRHPNYAHKSLHFK